MNDSVAYSLSNISRTYKGSPEPAVADVSLDVDRGEIFGLIGRNGSGKSTLIKMMVGLLRPDSGEVRFFGHRLRHEEYRHLGRVGYMPQSAFAVNNLKVSEAIFTVARLRGMSWAQARANCDDIINALDLDAMRGKVASSLSGGQRRMLQLAVTLAGDPDVLILDEPTNELDPGRRRFVWSYLQVQQQAGKTIILVTHNAAEADHVLERVGIMKEGRLIACDSPRDIKRKVLSLTRVRFLRRSAAPLPTFLKEEDPTSPYVNAYLHQDELRDFLEQVNVADLEDLTITASTLEDVYHGMA